MTPMTPMTPTLPVNQAWRDLEPHHYSVGGGGGKKEIQVYLQAATGERCGRAIAPDWVPSDLSDPIAVAKELVRICETKYLYCSGLDGIRRVLAAMEACAAMSEANARTNRMNELRKTIVLATNRIPELRKTIVLAQSELDELMETEKETK